MKTLGNIFLRSVKGLKYSLGKFLSEMGLGMDRLGSRLSEDVAYTQVLSRHRQIFPLYDLRPNIDYSFIAPNATLIGEVNVSTYASIWYNCTLRAELNPIRIGNYTSIGDGTLISTVVALPTGIPASVNIGNNCTIQSNCTIYSCIIDDDVFIGEKSIIMEGCKIEKGAVIAPNSLVPPGSLIPGGQLWGGNPVVFIRELEEKEQFAHYSKTLENWKEGQFHMNMNKRIEDGNDDFNPEDLVNSYITENYLEWRTKYYAA